MALRSIMPSIQVKDVPDEVHATLRRRAAAAGKSLQEYLLDQLVEEAQTPTLDELLDRASGRAGGKAPFKAAAKAVRAERDAR
jgi:plasmid stability protein